MPYNKNYYSVVDHLHFKNKQTSKLIEQEMRFVVISSRVFGKGKIR